MMILQQYAEALNNKKISVKLPLAIISMGIVTAIVISQVLVALSTKSLEAEINTRLIDGVQTQSKNLKKYLTSIESDLKIQGSNTAIVDALNGFSKTFMGQQKQQALYIFNNKYPTGKKKRIDGCQRWV